MSKLPPSETPTADSRRQKLREQECDFCQKRCADVGPLVEGPGSRANNVRRGTPGRRVYVCRKCADTALHMFAEQVDASSLAKGEKNANTRPSPRELVKYLNQHIIGQDDAKRTLAIAVANHYKRLDDTFASFPEEGDPLADVEIDKSNVLLIGPTGCGKTLMVRMLARYLNVPFAIADATTLTEAGYVGEDVENILLKLLQAAGGDPDLAERGIVYIDEIDKIGRTTQNVSITRDVSGEGVQQALLKILEGTVASVPPAGGRKHPEQQYIPINTEKVLFICGGAFVGLEQIIEQRLGKRSIGFNRDETSSLVAKTRAEHSRIENPLKNVMPEDLHRYGLIPEFIGRLPVLTQVSQLGEQELCRILTQPNNAICKQFQKLFRQDGVELQFTDDAIRELASQALRHGTGARSLRSVVEKALAPLMFDLGSSADNETRTITVTASMVRGEADEPATIKAA